jgi:hypothetical protein
MMDHRHRCVKNRSRHRGGTSPYASIENHAPVSGSRTDDAYRYETHLRAASNRTCMCRVRSTRLHRARHQSSLDRIGHHRPRRRGMHHRSTTAHACHRSGHPGGARLGSCHVCGQGIAGRTETEPHPTRSDRRRCFQNPQRHVRSRGSRWSQRVAVCTKSRHTTTPDQPPISAHMGGHHWSRGEDCRRARSDASPLKASRLRLGDIPY